MAALGRRARRQAKRNQVHAGRVYTLPPRCAASDVYNLDAGVRAAGKRPPGSEAAAAPQVLKQARDFELVGLSLVFQHRAPEYLQLAQDLKAQGVPLVVAGGHFASCRAAFLLEHCAALDAILLHEGERSLPRFLEVADIPARWSEVPGLVYRGGEGILRTIPEANLADLDRLPWPDRRGPRRAIGGVSSAYLLGSRGCLGSCAYCCITTLHRLVPGPRFRQRAPGAVA